MIGKGGIKNIEISAVITRADGTIEDLGVISKTSDLSIVQKFKEFVKGGK